MHRLSLRLWKASACLPLAASALGVAAQPPAPSAGSMQARTGTWHFHHEHVLGTSLEITVRARNVAEAHASEQAMLTAIDHDASLLSTWKVDSEVSRWSKTRFEAVPVSTELFEVLTAFDHWRARTGGALDASVETATRLWRNATAEGRVPSDRELEEATESMQQPHWRLDQEHQTATRLTEVPLTLASFTKSYISARAADAGLAAGATGVMLNVGGDVLVRGDLLQMVTIANPRAAAENEQGLEHIVVRNHAVATSGSYRRGFDVAEAIKSEAPQYSHLIDPRSARPANHVLSSTVVARDAVTAGAHATASSILPVEESKTLAATVVDLQYLLVLRDGSEVRSANWPQTVGLHRAAYAPAKPAVANGAWNTAFELSIDMILPRIEDARYRRPYVGVWIEDADHFPVRTLALWTQNPRWLPDLKQWYRDDQIRSLAEGTDLSRTVSSATRPPGSYSLKWDGKDNEGKLVKPGKYTIVVEAAREHGGYDIQKHELEFTGKPQQATLAAAKELGMVTLDYHKR